jgi:hypothetical protein
MPAAAARADTAASYTCVGLFQRAHLAAFKTAIDVQLYAAAAAAAVETALYSAVRFITRARATA